MKVYAGSSNLDLVKKIASELKVKLGEIEIGKFPNGEKRVIIKEEKVGRRAVLVQSLSSPVDEMIVETALVADALKRMGVEELIGVVPWMGYGKQDKVFQSGEPLSAQVVARILDTCEFSKIVTVDLHNSETIKLFSTPMVELSARSVLTEYFRNGLGEKVLVVAPDKGAAESARKMASELGVEMVRVEKRRDLVTGEVRIAEVDGEVRGKDIIIIDDNIVTGETLIKVSEELVRMGANSVKIAVTHHMYAPGVQEKIDGCNMIDELVITDTILQSMKSEKLKVLSVAKLIAKELE